MSDLYAQMRQALLSEILDVTADAIIAIDEKQTILLFSQGAERTFGYRAEEVLGRSLELLLPSHRSVTHGDKVRQFASSDVTSRLMTDQSAIGGRRKDGTEFPAETNITRVTVQDQTILVAFLRDITQRQRAEQALAESEERYRSIVTAISEGIVLQDAEGHIIACNESAERILGLAASRLWD